MTDLDFNINENEEETGLFKNPNLTQREHLDPDKHWIGEALPAAGATESKPSGSSTGPGTSPFPARADHVHDNASIFGHYYHNPMSLVHGQEKYFDQWVYYSGRNLLQPASTQLFLFPQEGLWVISGAGYLNAPTALNSSGTPWFVLKLDFNNVTYSVVALTQGISSPYNWYSFTFIWVMHVAAPVTPAINLQIKIANYSGQTSGLGFHWLNIRRDCSSVSA